MGPEGRETLKPSHQPSHTRSTRASDTSHRSVSQGLHPQPSKQPVVCSNHTGGVVKSQWWRGFLVFVLVDQAGLEHALRTI
jgi:hypothetical protein